MAKERNRSEQREARRLAKEQGLKYTEALRRVRSNPDTDPIAITHAQDPSLDEDEMILHTTIEPKSIKENDA